MEQLLRQRAESIWTAAIRSVLPDEAVRRALEHFHPQGRVFLVAAGKAAWQMAHAALAVLGRVDGGIVITKYGHVRGPLPGVTCCEAGHPVPDDNSFAATQQALALVSNLRADDTVLFLLSGGGSALFEKPLLPGAELQNITGQLLASGADIVEMNIIRKRLSGVKGGRFAQACAPAQVFSIVLSDVLGDPLDMIASGPAAPDSSTCAQALAIAEKSLPHLRNGLHSREDMAEAVRIIHRSTDCEAVMITDAKEVLAKVGGGGEFEALEHCPLIAPIPDSIRTGNALMEIYTAQGDQREIFCPALEGNVVIAAPLVEQDKVVGSLAIIVKKRWHGYKPHLIIVTELARLFSTQLELSDLDYQRRLRKRAELRALQNQVTPHFLYNILNTISSVCRENPDRARELLLTLSLYYRQTLENEQYMIRLSTELYQVMNYLKLEQARFEEKLAVEFDIEEELDCVLPSFILQPLVENAVRYGVDKRGFRIINISAETKEDAAVIAVTDHGSGIPDEVVRSLKAGQGKGVGLLNVHKRLQSLYGEEGGLQITVTENGSRVAFRIPLGKIEDLGEPAAISAQGRAV